MYIFAIIHSPAPIRQIAPHTKNQIVLVMARPGRIPSARTKEHETNINVVGTVGDRPQRIITYAIPIIT
jgi:hypothetical protein